MDASALEIIKELPDISFIDDISLEDVQELFFSAYQDKYKEETGATVSLTRGDPMRIALLSAAGIYYQALQKIETAGRMNYLKYAYGSYLDNLAATRSGVVRKPATPATVTVLWSLETARASATGIPAGTRVTADGVTYFATSEYAEIPAGATSISIVMTCTTAGVAGNGFAPGEVATIVDPVPFIASVRNTDTSDGGADIEDDESLAVRAFLAPSGFSVAGPEEAYIYRCLEYSPAIADVAVTGPTGSNGVPAGTVDIRVLMDDGSGPEQSVIAGLLEYLTDAPARPLTDHVQVSGPDFVSYSVSITYYIAASNKATAPAIQAAVENAVTEYVAWQSGKIGRDINPDHLLAAVKNAGAKRAVIASPVFTALDDVELAKLSGTPSITYGGIEDD